MKSLAGVLFAAAYVAFAADPTPLTPGTLVERQITGFQTHEFSITLHQGEYAGLILRHRGIDFTASVLAPDGGSVDFSVPQRSGDEESAGFVATNAGTYRLDIHSPYRGAGRYEIRLIEIRPATEHDRRLYEALKLGSDSYRLFRTKEYTKAIPPARRAAELFERELGQQNSTTARWLSQLGWMLSEAGTYDEAEPLLRRALDLQEKLRGPEHPETLSTLVDLGNVYGYVGDYARAEPLLSRACESIERTLGKDHPALASCLLAISTVHKDRADLAKAEDELQRAAAIDERMLEADDYRTLRALNNLGVLYNSRGEFARAEPILQHVVDAVQKALGPDSTELAMPLWNLALILQEYHKDFPRALDLYTRALALLERSKGPEHPDVGSVLNNTANIYKSLGDYRRAIEMHTRVHEMWEKALGPYHGRTVLSLGNLARTYASMGDAENTIKFQIMADNALEKNLELNLAIGSERQKLAYFDSVAERTDRTISYQVKLAPDSQAAARLAALAALQRKGRVLDAMSLNLVSLRERMNAEDRALLDAWNSATSQFAGLALRGPGLLSRADYQKQLAGLAEKRERAEAELSRRSAQFQGQSQLVTLAAVQTAVPKDAALIEFATWRPFAPQQYNQDAYGERRYIAYVVRASGDVRWKELGPAKEIDRELNDFRNALADPERQDVRPAARALDQRLMQPLRSLIGEATRLLISPEGSLNLLPFQALVDEGGQYLVERYSISYLSSGRDLLRLQERRASHSAPMVIADPSFGETERPPVLQASSVRRSVTVGADLKDLYFAPLAGAAQEARAIHELFPDARVLAGTEATESALKHVDAPSILHVATHGFFLPSTPGQASSNPLLRSGLALAGANRRSGSADDGIFTALEASGLNLWGTRLVTLSACDSGIGEIRSSEGVYGLRRAFVLAGAESLVMSLWAVSDSVTREMMTAFYTGLRHGLGRGEALRQAQLAMLKRKGREHPFYWASFIQSGEWGNLQGRR
ncbi:MAG TPA: CHAT domain-containing tetratricopeptide repeat protein [Bryobacteraceae bacterium]